MTAQGPDSPAGDYHDAEEIRFGAFQFFPARSVLMKDGKRVRIGSRALALLNVLVQNGGQFVPNDVLMAKAWPSTSVEESNLRVQMTTLRRLLDDGTHEQSHITNAPGRGYAFTSPLARLHQDKVSSTPDPEALHNLPIPLTPLIGRQDVIASIVDRLGTRRLISVVGPGGIGKTRVATEVSWKIADERGLRVCFVDLAPLASADFVTSAAAAALHLDYSETASPLDQIIKLLRQSEFLLVLDNCEHVIDGAAALAETLLRAVPKLRILATSREPLRAEGEVTVRLAGLDAPQGTAEIADLRSASQYPAIELFVERAVAGGDDISLLDADVPLISQICRQLDGIPLAIELAAARIGFLGIAGVAKHLESQFEILAEGRRTALPRHRTMRAALDWSFESLSENEQMLLTRLAVFRSTFSIEGAQAVASGQAETAIELLSNLVAKSLVVVDQAATAARYRLLETTRAFAEEKLRASADAATVWRQHAEYLLQLFSRGAASAVEPPMQRLKVYRQRVDDVRNALEWSFSASGDSRIGVKMIIDSAPMWLRLSLLSEYTAIVENAADRLAEDPDLNHRELMWLYAQLHTVHFQAVGISPKKERMLQTALDLAQSEGDHSCQLFCLWALFGTRLTQARYQTALDYALQFAAIAPQVPDPMQLAMGHRIVALGQWRSGDLKAANVHGEAALRATDETATSPINLTLIYKHGVTSRGNFSNLQWLSGHPEQALQMASEAVDAGLASEDFAGLSYSLAQTIVPLAFWVGDYELAGERTSQLLDLARANDFGFWLFWGRSYECARRRLQARKRDANDFIEANAGALSGVHRHILATILEDIAVDLTAEEAGSEQPHWCLAELLRREAVRSQRADARPEAERLLARSLRVARDQGALAWELRSATTLAELRSTEGRETEAVAILRPVFEQFTEGFETQDLRKAADLLDRTDPHH